MSQSNIKPANANLPSSTLDLSDLSQIDLTGLSPDQIASLKIKQAECMLDIQKKREELKMDIAGLDAALTSFNRQTDQATQASHSATIQHSQNSSLGRTEVIVGNTDKAATGKLSMSASGQTNSMVILAVAILAAVVILALALIK